MPKDEAYLEAEQKIQQALRSGATKLDLRNMKLTELPESKGARHRRSHRRARHQYVLWPQDH